MNWHPETGPVFGKKSLNTGPVRKWRRKWPTFWPLQLRKWLGIQTPF